MKIILLNLLSIKNSYSGAAVCALNILNELNRLISSKDNLKFLIFCQKSLKSEVLERLNSEYFQIIKKSFSNKVYRIFFEQFFFDFYFKKKSVSTIVSFSNIIPVFSKVSSNIVLLHDIIYKYFPERYTKFKKLYYDFFIPRTLKKADKIIVPTNSTKNDLLKFDLCSEKKIVKINYSYNELLKFNIDSLIEKKFLTSKKINFKYFLFVGTLEPGKNFEFLKKLMDKYDGEEKLVIVGNNGWKVKKSELTRFFILDNLSDTELSILYKNAQIFLYPSIYEGVGLPVIEAQQYKIPIICSDYPAAFEIINEKNILSLNIPNWINRIYEIKKNPSKYIDYEHKYSWLKFTVNLLKLIKNENT